MIVLSKKAVDSIEKNHIPGHCTHRCMLCIRAIQLWIVYAGNFGSLTIN